MDRLDLLKESIIYQEDEEEILETFTDNLGEDKCFEVLKNYKRLTKEDKVPLRMLMAFLGYEYELSSILYTVLRGQEDMVKAFLCNTYSGYPVNIEERPSNYTKTKYYFKIPCKNGTFVDIRTFVYTKGPVDYYDALKTMDFGDINLIFSHQDRKVIKEFSKNPSIVRELDMIRQIRNYVYHHNLLFSFPKKNLEEAIAFLLKNLPHDFSKDEYIRFIRELRYKGSERDFDIGEKIAIDFNDDLLKIIYKKY